MSLPILEINQLSKQFKRVRAVNNLTLSINQGDVFGILGPNGSGKSTTLGMLLGTLHPTSGHFSWFQQGDHSKLRKRIGATLERPIFYPYMSGRKNLEVVAQIKEVSKDRIDIVMKTTGLYDRQNDPFKTYSLGMKQRLSIASALLCDPEVLILDEPTNGLDPQGIIDIRNLIKEIAKTGKTIILASHLLDEVQKVCTRFCILKVGNLIHKGDVKSDFSDHLTLEIAAPDLERLETYCKSFPGVVEITSHKEKLILSAEKDLSILDLNQHLVKNNIIVTHLVTLQRSLEDQFLNILEHYEKTDTD